MLTASHDQLLKPAPHPVLNY